MVVQVVHHFSLNTCDTQLARCCPGEECTNISSPHQGLRPAGLGPSTSCQAVLGSMAAMRPQSWHRILWDCPLAPLWLRGSSMG